MTTPSDTTTETQVPTPTRLRLPRRERSPRPLRYDEAMVLIHRQFLHLRRPFGRSPAVVGEWQALRDAAWAAETATDPAERTAVITWWKELTESTRSRRGHRIVNGDATVDVTAGLHRHAVYARARNLRRIRLSAMVAHVVVVLALAAAWAWPFYLHSSDLRWLVDLSSYNAAPARLRTGMSNALWLATAVSSIFAFAATLHACSYLGHDRRRRGDRVWSILSALGTEAIVSFAVLLTGSLFLAVPA